MAINGFNKKTQYNTKNKINRNCCKRTVALKTTELDLYKKYFIQTKKRRNQKSSVTFNVTAVLVYWQQADQCLGKYYMMHNECLIQRQVGFVL